MLQIENIKLELDEGKAALGRKAAAALRVPPGEIQGVQILRRAVDAREGVRFVYTLGVSVKGEDRVLRRCRNRQVSRLEEKPYQLPPPVSAPPPVPPVVVGAGPGGLFCALALARCCLLYTSPSPRD